MSEDWGFVLPAFKPDEALQRLRRDARELGLVERGGVFERKGLALVKFALTPSEVSASVVKRPSRSGPEWQTKSLKTGADVRDFSAELKKRLQTWSDQDE